MNENTICETTRYCGLPFLASIDVKTIARITLVIFLSLTVACSRHENASTGDESPTVPAEQY